MIDELFRYKKRDRGRWDETFMWCGTLHCRGDKCSKAETQPWNPSLVWYHRDFFYSFVEWLSLPLDVRLYITHPVLSHLHVSPIYLSASSLSYSINPDKFSRFNESFITPSYSPPFLFLLPSLFSPHSPFLPSLFQPHSPFLPSLFVPQSLLTAGADVCGHGGEPSGVI